MFERLGSEVVSGGSRISQRNEKTTQEWERLAGVISSKLWTAARQNHVFLLSFKFWRTETTVLYDERTNKNRLWSGWGAELKDVNVEQARFYHWYGERTFAYFHNLSAKQLLHLFADVFQPPEVINIQCSFYSTCVLGLHQLRREIFGSLIAPLFSLASCLHFPPSI